MSYIDKDLPAYPAGAGYRDDEASREGARKVNADGSRLTQSAFVLAAIENAGPAGITSIAVFNLPDSPFREVSLCRARVSELLKAGKVCKKGERSPGEAGVSVNLWIAARFAPKSDDPQGEMFAHG